MQMPGNYPKARRVEAHGMKIEQAERERERDGDEPNTGFTCLVMQDDWGVLGGGGWMQEEERGEGRRGQKGDERHRDGWETHTEHL